MCSAECHSSNDISFCLFYNNTKFFISQCYYFYYCSSFNGSSIEPLMKLRIASFHSKCYLVTLEVMIDRFDFDVAR